VVGGVGAGTDPEDGTPLERFLASALTANAEVSKGDRGVTLNDAARGEGLEFPSSPSRGSRRGSSRSPVADTPRPWKRSGASRTVGVTRAKDKLFLTWAGARRRRGC